MTAPLFREALIDVAAIAANVALLAETTGVEVIAVVKANGYGHGAATVARAAIEGGAVRLGVADISEAVELREAGIDVPIIAWLHGPGEDFREAAERGIEVGVSSLGQLRAAAEASAPGRPIRVHVKVETGLSRNGAAPAEWDALFAEAARLEGQGRIRVAGLFSHFANTSERSNLDALGVYRDALAVAASHGVVPETRHIASTDAALSLPETRLDAVRPGIAVYGLSPFAGTTSAELCLRPAMTLRAGIAKVRRVPEGAGVSYDHSYVAERETTLALVPLGYADGLPRQASGRGPVSVNGRRYTVAGRIAMDQCVIDVGDDEVREGDVATLFGDPATGVPSVDEWAAAAGTINYEIVTRIGDRVPRVLR